MSQKPHPIIVKNLTGLFNCNRQKNCIFLLESVLPNLVASSVLVSLSPPLQLIFLMSQKPHPIIVKNLTGLFNCNRQKNCIFLLESVLPNLVASSLLVRIEFSSIICTPISVTMMKH